MNRGAARPPSLDEVATRGDLLRLLASHPDVATPAAVRLLKERVEDLYRRDARAAGELAECVSLLAERCGDLGSLALGHRARALAALASGSRREALAHYEEAERLYRLGADEVERARVLRSMMDALMHLGRHEEALAAGREAHDIFERHGSTVLAAQVDANIGSVYYRLDRNAEALEAFNRALRVFRRERDDDAVAMMEFSRANVFANLNQLGEAERGYRRALRFYRRRGFRLREAQCLYGLAYLAYLRCRYTQALRLFERVRRLDLQLGDLRHAALCDLDRSELLLSLNAWREASELGEEAQGSLETLGMTFEAAKALLFRGVAAVHLRRFVAAVDLLEEAGRRFEREGNEVHRGLADLYRAELALRREDPAAARGLARGAARLFAGEGLRTKEAYARVIAACALLRLGRLESARRQCHRSLEVLGGSASPWVAFRAHHLLGKLEPDLHSRTRHLNEALELVERLRADVVPDELRASFQRDKIALYEDCARLLLPEAPAGSLATGRERTGPNIEAAFGVVELAKSRALGDYLAGLHPEQGATGARGRAASAAYRRHVEELNAWYRRLNAAELAGRPDQATQGLRDEISARERRLSRLLRIVQLEQPQGTTRRRRRHARGFHTEAVPVAEVRDALGPGELLVEFFSLGAALHAFVVRPDGAEYAGEVAGCEEVREAVRRWRFLVEKLALGADYLDAHRESLRAGADHYLDRLGGLLMDPLEEALDGARAVVVVPAGPLFYVPFHATRSRGRYLVERFEISQAPSARAFALSQRLRPESVNPPLVLGLEKPELPSVAEEIAAVRDRLPGARVLEGEKAKRSALRRFGRGAPVIHIAAHARFRSDSPLLSAVELADGWLTFHDLFGLRLDCNLVVLSGCQTGEHEVLEGDELMGLSRGFLYAGTAALLASLWPVDDSATARFMERFYSGLAGGARPRASLRGAMLELLTEGALPHEWAPFYLTGKAA